jgi:hypothetical protein
VGLLLLASELALEDIYLRSIGISFNPDRTMTQSLEPCLLKQVAPRDGRDGVWVVEAVGCTSLPLATPYANCILKKYSRRVWTGLM